MVMYWRPPPEAMRASKPSVEMLCQEGLEGHHVFQRAGFGHVAAVEQGVDAHRLTPSALACSTIAFRWSMWLCTLPSENRPMKWITPAVAGLGAGDDLLPGLALPDGAVGDGVGHQRRALGIDLAGADGVVADFRIAHVVVGRHAHRGAVGAQADVRVVGEQRSRVGLRRGDGAADIGLGQAVAVHDDGDDRAGNTGEGGKLLQHGGFPAERTDRKGGALGKEDFTAPAPLLP
jgi:hypothetical protein